MIHIGEEDSAGLVTHDLAYAAVRAALIAAASGRSGVFPAVLGRSCDPGNTFSVKSGWSSDLTGVKVGSFWSGNPARGLPRHNSTIVLLDQETGRLRAVIEAGEVNAYRTAASDAVAADLLARPEARVLAVFGAGNQALFEVAALARIRPETDLAAVGAADLVVESATEKEAIKNSIFESLAPYLAPQTILTTNTSSISITRLAARTDRPERFMGFHFMNPVPVMQLVELIRGIATDQATYDTLLGVVETLGKTAASSEDYPAFIVNRILIPMINEAVYALYEGVGSVASIDISLKLGANHPMGPLELADFIGLDTCLAIMNVLHEGLADTKYRPCPLLVKYVEAGWLGRKSKRGFYDYRGETPVPTR